MNEQTDDLPGIHPEVQSLLDNLAPGDLKFLPEELGGEVYRRYIRLQMNPYVHYGEAEARWIKLALRRMEVPK
jgi:hypothetical protein